MLFYADEVFKKMNALLLHRATIVWNATLFIMCSVKQPRHKKKKLNKKKMMFDNFYFLNTPFEIQEECYDYIEQNLNKLNLNNKDYVYLLFSAIGNIMGKYCFKVYVKNNILSENEVLGEPDFLIFIPNV